MTTRTAPQEKNIEIQLDNGLVVAVEADVIDAAFFAARHGEAFLYEGTDFVIEVERSEEKEWSSAIDHLIDGSDFIYAK